MQAAQCGRTADTVDQQRSSAGSPANAQRARVERSAAVIRMHQRAKELRQALLFARTGCHQETATDVQPIAKANARIEPDHAASPIDQNGPAADPFEGFELSCEAALPRQQRRARCRPQRRQHPIERGEIGAVVVAVLHAALDADHQILMQRRDRMPAEAQRYQKILIVRIDCEFAIGEMRAIRYEAVADARSDAALSRIGEGQSQVLREERCERL